MNPAIWRHVRAVVVAVHVLAVFVMAFPAPGGGMQRSSWKNPTVQAEFQAWTDRVNALGWEISDPDFEDILWAFSSGYMEYRAAIIKPFGPYYRFAGTHQSWRMFVAPHMFPSRLHIDIEVDGEWQQIYVGRSNEFTWHRSQLDHDRMRSALFRYAWPAYRGHYRRFVSWVGKQVAADFPAATRVRVQYHRVHTPSPEAVRAGGPFEGKFHNVRVVKLR